MLLSLFVLTLVACQPQPDTKPIDLEAEEAAVNNLLNKLNAAFKGQDVVTLTSLLNEGVLFCGSDPSEVWNKQQITEIWTQMLSQPFEIEVISEPIIKIAVIT